MKRAIVEQNNLGTQVEQSNFLFDDVQSGKRTSPPTVHGSFL
jgi:hypothetical protein